MLLIWNDLACVHCTDHHREKWFRRNNLYPELENDSEQVLKHSSSATARKDNHHALVFLLSKVLYYKLINKSIFFVKICFFSFGECSQCYKTSFVKK